MSVRIVEMFNDTLGRALAEAHDAEAAAFEFQDLTGLTLPNLEQILDTTSALEQVALAVDLPYEYFIKAIPDPDKRREEVIGLMENDCVDAQIGFEILMYTL